MDLKRKMDTKTEPVNVVTGADTNALCLSSLQELESISGVDASYWCRWFAGAEPSEINGKRVMNKLSLSKEEFNRLLYLRRKIYRANKGAGRLFSPHEAERILKRILAAEALEEAEKGFTLKSA